MKIEIGTKIEIIKGRSTGTKGVVIKVGPTKISPKYGDVTRIDFTSDLSWIPGAEIIPGYCGATDMGLVEVSK